MIVGSKESVGDKYKDGICAKLWLRYQFESDWCFSQDGFEGDFPETKF